MMTEQQRFRKAPLFFLIGLLVIATAVLLLGFSRVAVQNGRQACSIDQESRQALLQDLQRALLTRGEANTSAVVVGTHAAALECPACPTTPPEQLQLSCPECETCQQCEECQACPPCVAQSGAVVEEGVGVSGWHAYHDMACGEVLTNRWKRRLCFSPLDMRFNAQQQDTPWVLPELSLELRVTGALALAGGKQGKLAPVCNDTMRIQLIGDDVHISPSGVEEVACGVYRLRVQLPAANSSYVARVRILHVDGEGGIDPEYIMTWLENVMGNPKLLNQGPIVYNLDAGIKGRLYVRHTPHPGGALELSWPATPLDYRQELPICKGGDTPGRWSRAQNRLYPPFLGEHLNWLPYTCRYNMYTSSSLRTCLVSKLPKRVTILGESIMGQMFFLFAMHASGMKLRSETWPQGGFYWPSSEVEYHRNYANADTEVFDHISLFERHGLYSVIEAMNQNPEVFQSGHLVIGTGHNDMMRKTFATFEENLALLVKTLKENNYKGQLIYMTAPVRHYKAFGGHPDECVCPDGRPHNCTTNPTDCLCDCAKYYEWFYEYPPGAKGLAYSDQGFLDAPHAWNAEGKNRVQNGIELPLMCNTYNRVKLANKVAVATLRKAFPWLIVLDYEAITDPLPSDFCFDGLHYGCFRNHVEERKLGPWQCRNLANRAVANVLANILCNEQ